MDASVVVSAAVTFHGTAARAVDHAREQGRIALSDATLRELHEVFARPKIHRVTTQSARESVLGRVLQDAAYFHPTLRIAACRDPKDDKYLELALAAGAAAIVTGDADLLALHPFRGIPILSPAAFLDAFGT